MKNKPREEMLEKDVRDPSVKFANKFGDVKHKRMHFGQGAAKSWPDDLFIFRDGHHWWVEFKRPGGEATPSQANEHNSMREFNADVSVIDDEVLFKQEFDQRRYEAKFTGIGA